MILILMKKEKKEMKKIEEKYVCACAFAFDCVFVCVYMCVCTSLSAHMKKKNDSTFRNTLIYIYSSSG